MYIRILSALLLFILVIQNTFATIISWTVDTSFNIWDWFNEQVKVIVTQSDWKILVWWLFSAYNWNQSEKLARLNTDGSFDSSFNIGSWFNWLIRSIIPLSDWKVLVWWQFTTFNWNATYPYLLRLNSDWTLDTTFTRWLLSDYITTISLYNNKIYIWWSFVTYNWNNSRYLARLNMDWSFDSTFAVWTNLNGVVNSMVIDSNGRIIIIWTFNLYWITSTNRIARLNNNGSLDWTYSIGTWLDNTPNSISLWSNNSVIIWWLFSKYNWTNSRWLVRILSTWLIDSTFQVWSWFNWNVNINTMTSSWLVAWWTFTTYNWVTENRIVGVTSTGLLSSEVNFWSGFNLWVQAISIDERWRLIIWWLFNDYNWYYYNRIIRLLLQDSIVDTPPSNITISSNSINEFSPLNSIVWTLSSTGAIWWTWYTFYKNCTIPWGDENLFTISGSQLILNEIPNATSKNSYSICIKSVSTNHLSLDKNMIIQVNDLPPNIPTIWYPINNAIFKNDILIFTWTAQKNTSVYVSFSWKTSTWSSDSVWNYNIYTQDIPEWINTFTVYAFDNWWTSSWTSVDLTFDYTKPVITLNGSWIINIPQWEIYVDSGATAMDNIDWNITNRITQSWTFINTNTLWNYNIVYTVSDNAWNIQTKTRLINVIDITKPTAIIEYSNTWITNQNIISTLTWYSEQITITSSWGNSHTFTENGSFIFEFQDLSGNTWSTVSNVSNIDKEKPIINIIGDINIILEQSSTGVYIDSGASWSDNNDWTGNIIGSWSINMNIVWSYIIEYNKIDNAWNYATKKQRNIQVVDTKKPIATVEYSNTWITNQNVIATLTWISETINITSSWETTHIFLNNWTFTFTYEDLSGNTGETISSVYNIDKQKPEITIIWDDIITIEQSSTWMYIDSWANWLDNNDWTGYIDWSWTVNVWVLWSYNIEYKKVDNAWNIADIKSRTINVIDINKPSASIIYSNTGITNQNVIATITDETEPITITSSWWLNHTFTGNGIFTFTYEDISGNTWETIATVANIDKEKPEVTIIWSGTIILEQSETWTYIDEWWLWSDNNDWSWTLSWIWSVNLKVLWNYTIEYYKIDTAGNNSDIKQRIVSVIDTNKPTAVIEYSNTWITNQNVTATLTNESEQINIISSGWLIHTFTDNWTFTFIYSDTSGNTWETTATVTNIDKELPIINIIGDTYVTLEKSMTWIYNDSWSIWEDNRDWSWTVIGSWIVDLQNVWIYNIEYTKTDNAWNISITKTRTVEVVDTTKPFAQVEYSYSGITNNNIIATLTWISENVTIQSVGGNSHIFTENGEFIFDFIDDYWNTGSITATVNWIDKDFQMWYIEYSNTWITNQNVIAYLTWFTEEIIILNNTWVINEFWINKHIFNNNDTFIFEFRDNAWNTGTLTAVVDWIDKELPEVTINWSWTIILNIGDTYNELWANATDNMDTTVNNKIVLGWTFVNTMTSWIYTVTYSVSDMAWNQSIVKTRNIDILSNNNGDWWWNTNTWTTNTWSTDTWSWWSGWGWWGNDSWTGSNNSWGWWGGNWWSWTWTIEPPSPPVEPPYNPAPNNWGSSSVWPWWPSPNAKIILTEMEEKYRPWVLLQEKVQWKWLVVIIYKKLK